MGWASLEQKMQRYLKSKVHLDFNSDFLAIREIGFFGLFSVSPNQRYILAWSDSDPESGRAGCRKRGHGTYILLEDARLILYGRQIQRPNHGKVADNGTFIFNDWLFGLGAKGTFYAFDRKGNILVQKRVKANLYNNGISNCGRYAVFWTHGTEKSLYRIYFFDLENKTLLWSKVPEPPFCDFYEWDVNKGVLYLVYRDGRKYAYGFDGKFLDKDKLEKDRKAEEKRKIESGDPEELYHIATRRLEYPSLLSAEELLETKRILKQAAEGLEYWWTKADAYKRLGMLYEEAGEYEKAIDAYEKAIASNPKIGLKRKVKSMKAQYNCPQQGDV